MTGTLINWKALTPKQKAEYKSQWKQACEANPHLAQHADALPHKIKRDARVVIEQYIYV